MFSDIEKGILIFLSTSIILNIKVNINTKCYFRIKKKTFIVFI